MYDKKRIQGDITPKELLIALNKMEVGERVALDVEFKMTKGFKEQVRKSLDKYITGLGTIE